MRRITSRIRSLVGLSSSAGLERLLARLTGGAFVLEVVGAAAAFGVQWLLARVLGAGGLGIYLFCLGWVRLLALPGKLGLERASLRFVAALEARAELGALRGFLIRGHQLVLLASTLLGVGLYLVSRRLADRLEPELVTAFGWAALALPLIALVGLHGAMLRGFKRITWSLGAQKVLRPVVMLVLVGLAVWLGDGLRADRAMALQAATLAVVLAVSSVALVAAAPAGVTRELPEYRTRAWLAVSLPLLLITGFNIVLRQTDIVMVGSLLSRADAGVYGTAVRIAMLIQFGLNAVNAGLAPLISQLHAQERRRELAGVVALGARLIFLFTLVVSLAVFFGGRSVLAIFGPEFPAGVGALRVLVVSQVVNSLAGPVGLLMTMTGHQKTAAKVLGGSALLNIALNFVLIPRFGIEGAAVATTLATVAWNVILVVQVRRRLAINPLVRW